MRFSIRWLLAATAYVALATAAIATGNVLLTDVVWAVTLLAVCFAIVVVCVARRQRQAMALGFVVLATAHLAGLYLMPNRVPAMRLISVAGYIVNDTGTIYEIDPAKPGAYREVRIGPAADCQRDRYVDRWPDRLPHGSSGVSIRQR